jgi:hypothetical protein
LHEEVERRGGRVVVGIRLIFAVISVDEGEVTEAQFEVDGIFMWGLPFKWRSVPNS